LGHRILIAYSTIDGHTATIARTLSEHLSRDGHAVEVIQIGTEASRSLDRFSVVIVGGSIRYGHHSPQLVEFVTRNQEALSKTTGAFFSVNAVARKPNKRQADTNPYVRKFLRSCPWKPDHVEVFAGRINYPQYRFIDRQVIRLIMWITGGPTDPTSVTDFTDWEQVKAFAQRISSIPVSAKQ
jgi:menaquinone-dependent protoporphyrinogen oxidase